MHKTPIYFILLTVIKFMILQGYYHLLDKSASRALFL